MLKKIIAMMLLLSPVYAGDDALKPFPSAVENLVRFVITLDPLPNEEAQQLEILVGKDMMVDCNRTFFGGTMMEETLEGWGYTYYVVRDLNGPASTLMACPPDEPKRTAFVSLNTHGQALKRYNSKLPIVVYVPKGFEVRYRVWRVDETIHKADAR